MLKKVFKLGIQGTINTFLFSCFFSFFLFPFISKLEITNKIIATTKWGVFIGILSLFLILLLILWKKMNFFWIKYRKTCELKFAPPTLPDFISLFLLVSSILVIFFQKDSIISLSSNMSFQFKIFLTILVIIFISWVTVSFYFKPTWRRKSEIPEISKLSLSDNPIQFKEQDLLDRSTFVNGLYSEVSNLPFSDSFVFGLYGNWGDGKTSIVNLLKQRINKESDFIWILFDPWYYQSSESIIKAFYEQIEKTITKEYLLKDLKGILSKYINIQLKGFSPQGINLNFIDDNENLNDVKMRIETYVNSIEKKFIIIVDDIDRLEPENILLIFKLVRLNTNFQNIIFLLSFDYSVVVNKLNFILNNDAHNYVDKIVQKQILLPKPEQNTIDKILFLSDHEIPKHKLTNIEPDGQEISTFGYIEKIIDNTIEIKSSLKSSNIKSEFLTLKVPHEKKVSLKNFSHNQKIFVKGRYFQGTLLIEDDDHVLRDFRLSLIDSLFLDLYLEGKIDLSDVQQFDSEVTYLYLSKLNHFFPNLRSVKRFINSLSSSLPPIVKEIDLKDFFLLEIIKVFEVQLFNHVYQNWWLYVKMKDPSNKMFNPHALRPGKNEDEKRKKNIEIVETEIEKYSKDIRKNEIIFEILEELFPLLNKSLMGSVSQRDIKKIATENFSKYFIMRVPSFELSFEYFSDFLNNYNKANQLNEKEFQTLILELQENGLLKEFLNKLTFHFALEIEPNVAEFFINFISKNINNFSQIGTENFWNSEFDKARNFVLKLLNTKIPKNRIMTILENIINQTPNLNFATSVLRSCDPNRSGDLLNIYGSIDFDDLKKILADRLHNHFIVSKNDIFKEYPKSRDWVYILYQWSVNWTNLRGQIDWQNLKTNYKITVNRYINYLISNFKENFLIILNYNDKVEESIFRSGAIIELEDFIRIANGLEKKEKFSFEEKQKLQKLYYSGENFSNDDK